MTVEELRQALKNVPGCYTVFITLPDDEFRARCVTQSTGYLRICKQTDGVTKGEKVLHSEEVRA